MAGGMEEGGCVRGWEERERRVERLEDIKGLGEHKETKHFFTSKYLQALQFYM